METSKALATHSASRLQQLALRTNEAHLGLRRQPIQSGHTTLDKAENRDRRGLEFHQLSTRSRRQRGRGTDEPWTLSEVLKTRTEGAPTKGYACLTLVIRPLCRRDTCRGGSDPACEAEQRRLSAGRGQDARSSSGVSRAGRRCTARACRRPRGRARTP